MSAGAITQEPNNTAELAMVVPQYTHDTFPGQEENKVHILDEQQRSTAALGKKKKRIAT